MSENNKSIISVVDHAGKIYEYIGDEFMHHVNEYGSLIIERYWNGNNKFPSGITVARFCAPYSLNIKGI